MQLIVDIGNTRIKSYVFKGDRVIDKMATPLENGTEETLTLYAKYKEIDKVMISDVRGSVSKTIENQLAPQGVVYCSMALKLPFQTRYHPSEQLGADRVALLAASCIEYPNIPRLIIDLGSCITYDFIDEKNLHHGGAISPGFLMRYKSMHTFTGKLPNLTPETVNYFQGTNTAQAMHLGVYQGIINEIKGVMNQYFEIYKDLTIILTGGDTERLSKPLKNSIFADSNFIANGLNYILKMNSTL